MAVIYPNQNFYDNEGRNRPDGMVYDLNEEKKMIAKATEEIKKELWAKWQRRYANAQIFPDNLNGANPNLVEFLLSFNNTLFYNDLAKRFNLNQAQRDTLPQIIWEIAISKNWNSISNFLSSKLNLSPAVSDQFAQLINQNILLKTKELSESQFIPHKKVISGVKAEAKKMVTSLVQAIQTFPQLGEQLITFSPIKLKIFPSPIRPSIKNWIEDYRQNMGAQKHGMMERGNYLFHSENTRRLTSGERKKLGEILRSLDEDSVLPVDPDRQEVVFEELPNIESSGSSAIKSSGTNLNDKNFNSPQNKQPTTYNPKSTTYKFSSPQVLPSERKEFELSSHQSFGSSRSSAIKPSEFEKPSSQREPKIQGNVVDLKN